MGVSGRYAGDDAITLRLLRVNCIGTRTSPARTVSAVTPVHTGEGGTPQIFHHYQVAESGILNPGLKKTQSCV